MLLEEVNGIMEGYFMLMGKKAPFHKAAASVQVTPNSTLLLLRVQQCLCGGERDAYTKLYGRVMVKNI